VIGNTLTPLTLPDIYEELVDSGTKVKLFWVRVGRGARLSPVLWLQGDEDHEGTARFLWLSVEGGDRGFGIAN
jgi:hypothetical protein